MDAAAYDVKKVVQNRVVREVDEVRQHEMRQWLGISVVLVLVLLGSVWLQAALRGYGYRLEALHRQIAEQEQARRRLELQVGKLSAPKRIEEYATRRLHLVAPNQEDAIVIDRILLPEAPPSSVVAARR
jgi:cell division protein FtsL